MTLGVVKLFLVALGVLVVVTAGAAGLVVWEALGVLEVVTAGAAGLVVWEALGLDLVADLLAMFNGQQQ